MADNPFLEKWNLDKKGHCPHKHTYEDRIFLGYIPKDITGVNTGHEIYQCPECGYIYVGIGIPLAYYLK